MTGSIPLPGTGNSGWRLAFGGGGRLVAIPWAPRVDPELWKMTNPDPQDFPQPRVTVLDLTGAAPPRTLIAPPGFVGGAALSPDGKTVALGTTGGGSLVRSQQVIPG